MKMIFLLLFFPIAVLRAQPLKKSEFILKGEVNYKTNRHIYFVWYNNDEQRFLDSAQVINGKFMYKGISNGFLDRFYIKTNPNNTLNVDSLDNVHIAVDNSVMYIKLKVGQFSKYKLTGSPSKDSLAVFEKRYIHFYIANDNNNKIINDKSTSPQMKRRYEVIDSMMWIKLKLQILGWCKRYPSNNLTPYCLYLWADYYESEQLNSLYKKISQFQQNSFYGIKLKKIIEVKFFQKNQIGKTAFDFKQMDFDNREFDFKAFSNKNYVLIDFWASWCKPCRLSHPDLISLYKKYSSINFQMLSISVDSDSLKWKDAIIKDSLNSWTNILDVTKDSKLRDNLASKYLINEFPTKILIDDNGYIIGRYVGTNLKELEEKLKVIFKY